MGRSVSALFVPPTARDEAGRRAGYRGAIAYARLLSRPGAPARVAGRRASAPRARFRSRSFADL